MYLCQMLFCVRGHEPQRISAERRRHVADNVHYSPPPPDCRLLGFHCRNRKACPLNARPCHKLPLPLSAAAGSGARKDIAHSRLAERRTMSTLVSPTVSSSNSLKFRRTALAFAPALALSLTLACGALVPHAAHAQAYTLSTIATFTGTNGSLPLVPCCGSMIGFAKRTQCLNGFAKF